MLAQNSIRNRLLSKLNSCDFAAVAPHLQPTALDRREILIEANRPIEQVYFIESGTVSVVARKQDGRSIEVGVYGRDGMSGVAPLLGSDRTPYEHGVQIAGSGFRLGIRDYLGVISQNARLKEVLLRFVHIFMSQTAHTALVNGRSIVVERLARWLLMCQDRIDGDEVAITHDFLSTMLGVRRSSVTDALHLLESNQLIKAERGRIKILNREKLEATAGSAYGVPEAEFRRLLGPL